MLFDLRGSGRRRTVKIVYITLAFLMGGGLVLFGIGGGGGISGGLVDAITERDGGGDTGTDRFTKQEKAALAKTKANAAGRARLGRARPRALPARGLRRELRSREGHLHQGRPGEARQGAGDAWERYLALNPKKPDDRVASLMVQAFGALNEPAKAATAQEVITDARPTASTFTQLAIFAYQAGQTRKGDLAKDKALELTDPDMREALKGQLESAKQQAAGAAAQPSATP